MTRSWHSGLVVLVLLLSGCGSAPAETATGVPTAPEGTRWVGWGRVVVAVPDWWTTGETRCYAPVEDTVYFESGAVADCADGPTAGEVGEVSSLAVLQSDRGYGELKLRDMSPVAEVAGREVLEAPGCDEWFRNVCRRLFAVPSEDVVFAVTIDEEGDGDYEEIRDSLRLLPEGMTTVPLAWKDGWTPTWGAEPESVERLRTAIEGAGLRVETVRADTGGSSERVAGLTADGLVPGSLLGVDPALGSPIELGGTVALTVVR